MMKKVDAWAILRFEEEDFPSSDYVSIKGIYDNEQAAYLALQKVQANKENYVIERTRRFTEKDLPIQPSLPSAQRIQGLDISLFNEKKYYDNDSFSDELNNIRELWKKLPIKIAQKTLLPLLNYLTKSILAQTLGAEMMDEKSQLVQQYDLKLNTGEKIEVKIVILDPQNSRSPNLQFPENISFDFLVIVVFLPDLTIAIAKMIPVSTLEFFARSLSNQKSLMNIRVTEYLLNHPSSQDINLGQIGYCESLAAS